MKMNEKKSQVRFTQGFTIAELLVVLGVLAILIAMILPSLSMSKGQSMAAVSLSNIRQMALGVQMYADENRDLPPVFGTPQWPVRDPWHFDFGDTGTGNWFEHSVLYALAITSMLGTTEFANAPGSSDPFQVVMYNSQPSSGSDYLITNTLYADPAFFDYDTQMGLSQMRPQRLGSIVFPADKGLLYQYRVFHQPQFGPVVACCDTDVLTPIAFADLSASEHIMRRMNNGIVNLYNNVDMESEMDLNDIFSGVVSDTRQGTRGRDR